ncbi:MAG: hypothetical protein JWQ81_1532 [Amycolatopsis sp.]|jgi:hypothetical protein|uniref:hypothetical protein n=1 Tax=Amycolatopsis sp. TaxID=37632 RepID=UPI0026053A76|nr:hypothetical protein [Amycolatopsis sp.]MCU1680793.1 hypothetical protein [Amycolatopsis sp.]
MPDFEVNPDAVHQYAQVLDGFNSAIGAINGYVHDYGCDKSGFTGLFIILQPVVDLVGSLYGDTLKFGSQRLASLVDGVNKAADAFQQADENAAKSLEDILNQLDDSSSSTAGAGASGEPQY